MISEFRLTAITMSAPIDRQSETGTGFTRPPSTSHWPFRPQGVKMPGSDMLDRTASMRDPSRSHTSPPVLRSVATAAKRHRQVLDQRIGENLAQIAGDPLPSMSPERGDHHIHETNDVRPGKLAHPPVQRIEETGGEGSGDQRADGGATGDINRNPRLQQAPDHADVRPSRAEPLPRAMPIFLAIIYSTPSHNPVPSCLP